jgi:2,3-bisphosphoglycerate-dependent phosphoglycerate mutase
MGKLILVRHGESLWNKENIFSGWTDVDLSPMGIKEAKRAGELIKNQDISIDICFTSYLKRAIRTSWILLETSEMMYVDSIKSWKLNERHYGEWQGRNKEEVKNEVSEERFLKIRRGYETPPPSITIDDKRHPKFDKKYHHIPADLLPTGESLKMTRKRVVQYFFERIAPQLAMNKTVLVCAHGNSLRALIGEIANIEPKELSRVEIDTGVPHVYEFDDNLNLG